MADSDQRPAGLCTGLSRPGVVLRLGGQSRCAQVLGGHSLGIDSISTGQPGEHLDPRLLLEMDRESRALRDPDNGSGSRSRHSGLRRRRTGAHTGGRSRPRRRDSADPDSTALTLGLGLPAAHGGTGCHAADSAASGVLTSLALRTDRHSGCLLPPWIIAPLHRLYLAWSVETVLTLTLIGFLAGLRFNENC